MSTGSPPSGSPPGSRSSSPASPSRLGVLVDGVPMADEEARAFWARFSAHMEENRGDLAGFAAREGFKSVHPATQEGRAVLLASRETEQRAYTSAGAGPKPPSNPKGGSPAGGAPKAPNAARKPDTAQGRPPTNRSNTPKAPSEARSRAGNGGGKRPGGPGSSRGK